MAPTARRRAYRRSRAERSPSPQVDGKDIVALGIELDRLRRRVKRLHYQMRRGGTRMVWSRWSRAVSECAQLCERIARSPVHDLAGLAVRYRALLWELVEDDLILDLAVRRRVIAFGRELEAMARREGGA